MALTKRQEDIIRRAFGQIAYHAFAARKMKNPKDLKKLREHAMLIEEVGRAIKESIDLHVGASAVLDKAG